MKVLFLTLSRINSIEERGIYTDLLRKFRDEGHDVTIVTPAERRLGIDTNIFEVDGVRVLQVQTLNPNGVLVNELISRIDYDNGCGINTDLYKISNINVDNMSDDYKRALVAQEAYGKKIDGNITFRYDEHIAIPFT